MKRGTGMKDLTGHKFGRLTAIKPLEKRRNGQVVWHVKCDCGNEVDVVGKDLTRGRTKSCGCLRKEYQKKNMLDNGDKITGKNLKENTNISRLNETISKNNTSGIRGVCFIKRTNSWRATIGFKKKMIFLGYFKNIEDAITARKEAEEIYYKPIVDKYKREE